MGVSAAYLHNRAFVIIIISWGLFEKHKYQIYNVKNIRSVEMNNCIFDTYRNFAMPHGKNSGKQKKVKKKNSTNRYYHVQNN